MVVGGAGPEYVDVEADRVGVRLAEEDAGDVVGVGGGEAPRPRRHEAPVPLEVGAVDDVDLREARELALM